MSNTYFKLAPNAWVMKTEATYAKGDIALIENKYGQETEVEVFKLVKDTPAFKLYSFVRIGESYSARKAARYQNQADNAEKRANDWQGKANEGRDFLVLAEPIKIGHHSEKRHRALIERNHARMTNCIAESNKAEAAARKAAYWESKAEKITLAMPESLEFFEYKLEQAKQRHQELKKNPELRQHSYSLTYANKDVKELTKKLETARLMWSLEG